MAYVLYTKHSGQKTWDRFGSYKFKRTAELKALDIRTENPFIHTMIKEVKQLLEYPKYRPLQCSKFTTMFEREMSR